MKWAIFVFIRVICVRKKWIPDVLLHMLHLLHKFPFLPKAMLFTSKSITPRLQKHCFQTVRTMLLASKSNAPSLRKQCFGRYGAMLWRLQNNALVVTELCSVWYGAMLCKVWSSALDGHMRCRRWWNDLYQQKALCTTRWLDRGHALLKPIYLFFERSDGSAGVYFTTTLRVSPLLRSAV